MTNTPSIERLKELLRLQRGAANIIMSPALAYDLLATLTPSAGEVELLRLAAQQVLDGLNARIDAADPKAVPIFDGIAELHSALASLASPPLPHPDIEGRAREMLAAEFDERSAAMIRGGHWDQRYRRSLRAIVKALSLPTTEIRREAAQTPASERERRLEEALKPFVDVLERHDGRYRKRGGNPDDFPDTHPSFDISASELPIGVFRRARSALNPTPEGSGNG